MWRVGAQVGREPPPPLPGGYTVGEQVYFTGAGETLKSGDRVEHGKQGEVVGPAKAESVKGKGVAVLFPGNKGAIVCFLDQVHRFRMSDLEALAALKAESEAAKAATAAAQPAADEGVLSATDEGLPPAADEGGAPSPAALSLACVGCGRLPSEMDDEREKHPVCHKCRKLKLLTTYWCGVDCPGNPGAMQLHMVYHKELKKQRAMREDGAWGEPAEASRDRGERGPARRGDRRRVPGASG